MVSGKGYCEHGNELLGSIQRREFLDYSTILLASLEGICFTELLRELSSLAARQLSRSFSSSVLEVFIRTLV
jgi:hypothetical protein